MGETIHLETTPVESHLLERGNVRYEEYRKE